jgi:RNA polymerase sigma-70 factor (ECF subfamily)
MPAVRELFDAHFDVVWRTVRRLGLAPASADDVAQEVFVVAARKLDAIEAGRERSFLVGTAIRLAANARRSRDRHAVVDIDDLAVASERPLPDALVDARRSLALLDTALAALPDELRVVLVLTELDAMTQPEVAELLGIPLGTIASRIRRARYELATRVAELRRDPQPLARPS